MGNFTFDTIVKIRIPNEYDVHIPELKSWAPIIHFMPTKVRNVVNIMERGIAVEFEKKEVEMEVFTLIKQFSLIANAENERVGKEIFAIPDKSQEQLAASLNMKRDIQKKKEEPVNPWANKNYTVREITRAAQPPTTTYKKKPKNKAPKLYEFLKEMKDPTVLPTTGYDDLVLVE